MNYKETMNFIKDTAKFSSRHGLGRIEAIMKLLGNPQQFLKCIHIAGTNGKGSTTAMISNILKYSDYKVGMYTSPYLEEFEERIQINGTNIPKERLCETVSKVAKAVEVVTAAGYDPPTEFEIITCAMFLYFYEEKVDFAVVEVGLGGRLDSTNIIIPEVSVITSISYDHMKILGNTLQDIAWEKAGIVKSGRPLVLYPQVSEVTDVVSSICTERGSELLQVPREGWQFISVEGKYQNIIIDTEIDRYNIKLALLGEVQILNCATSIATVEALMGRGVKIQREAILLGLNTVLWKGRMEVMREKPLVLLDGAHNIDGMMRLAESVKSYFKYNKLYLIIGILEDKQVEDMLRVIVPLAEAVIAVTPNSERAEDAALLVGKIEQFNSKCQAFYNYSEAYEKALDLCTDTDLLVVCGSLYMIGDMRRIIKGHR